MGTEPQTKTPPQAPEYLELVKMSDEELEPYGWRRNDQGGLSRIHEGSGMPEEPQREDMRKLPQANKPCGSCRGESPPPQKGTLAKGKKSLGLLDMINAKSGRQVAEHTRRQRLAICMSCQEKNTKTGTKLVRHLDGKLFCGEPRTIKKLTGLWRDEHTVGCGCDLQDKVKWWNSRCPRDRWGQGPILGSSTHIIVPPKKEQKIIEGVIDVVPRHPAGMDLTGIGDTISVIPIVHALAMQEEKRVRLRVIDGRMKWAELGWPDISRDRPDTDIGEDVVYLNPMCAKDTDLYLERRGMLSRQTYWFERVGVPEYRPKIDIKKEAEDWVREQVLAPKTNNMKFIVVSPFANGTSRQWPLHCWIDLIDLLTEAGHHVVMVDSESKRGRYVPCRRYWGWKPSHVAALLNAADLVIGNDSSMAHLAGLLERPTIAVCSSTWGKIALGWYKNMNIVQSRSDCTGCLWEEDRGFRRACTSACSAMWDIKPKRVFDAALNVLSSVAEAVSA